MLDLAIVNGRVVTPSGTIGADIGIQDSKIVLLAAPGTLPDSAETVDASGMLVLPGIIDSHFHCRAPSFPEREDFGSGTRAAAAGGVTTVIEMPISIPPTTDGKSLALRRSHAERDSYVDVGFYTSSATLDRERMQSGLDEGAIAFKAFLQELPVGREAEFEGICISTNSEIFRACELVAETGMPAVFHAEDYDISTFIGDRLMAAGRNDIAAHWEWRPDFVEGISVSTLLILAEATGARVHVPHVSSGLAVQLIRDAKARGVNVTAETCPPYLLFDRQTLVEHGPYAKCNPPLKTKADNEALWEGLRDGTIDTIATDHSPFTIADKEPGWENIWLAPPGFPSVEVLTQFVIGSALQGKLSLEHAVSLVTSAPADIFGLSPRKGRLIPGADADVTIYDPSRVVTVDTSTWQTRAKDCGRIWDGMQVQGQVKQTIVRGKTVYKDGEIVGDPGYGEMLRPVGREASQSLASAGSED